MIQFAAIVIALMFALAPPSQAQDIYKDCNGGEDTVRIIDACSTVLERGSLEAASNRRSALFYRGYAYQRVDRLEEGFADYRASLVIDPGFFPSKNNLSVGLTRRGSEAYNNKNYAQARADFTETVELKPDDVQSLTNLAALDYKEGLFDQAIAHCGVKIVGPRAQPVEMKRSAFTSRDDVSGSPGTRRFRNFNRTAGAKRFRNATDRFGRLREDVFLEIAAGHRNSQIADALGERRQCGLDRPRRAGRIARIRPLHRIIGEREIADRAREWTDMIE